MTTIRNRITALEGRLGGNEAIRFQRRLASMSDAELEAAIAAFEIAHPASDEQIRASVATGELTAAQAEELIALRAPRRGIHP